MQWAVRYPSEFVVLCNALIRADTHLPFVLPGPGGESISFTVSGFRPGCPSGPGRCIQVEAGNESARIWLSDCASRIVFGDVLWRAMDEAVQRLFVASRWRSLLVAASSVLQLPRLLARHEHADPVAIPREEAPAPPALVTAVSELTTPPQTRGTWLVMHAGVPGTPDQAMLCIELNPDLWPILATAVGRPVDRFNLSLTLNFVAGWQVLNQREWKRIERGSIVLLANAHTEVTDPGLRAADIDGRTFDGCPVFVQLAGSTWFLARHDANRLTVHRKLNIPMEPILMNHDAFDAGPASTDSLTLSFRLGSTAIRLSELQSIAPGYVFSTKITDSNPLVSIHAGEQQLGTGRIVAVGGMLGVEVLTWGNANNE